MTVFRLKDRALLRVSGDDAATFLHGLVTADIELIGEEKPGFGALLAPQGKILFEFIIHRRGDAFLLDCPAETIDGLVKRLGFYRLRAKIEFEGPCPDFVVVADDGADELAPDPRSPELGGRGIIASDAAPDEDGTDDYHGRRIALGIAECGRDYSGGEIFPHEASFDRIAGVSLVKGCYVGQEVVSRMHHRGTARKRFLPCRLEGDAAPVGTKVTLGGRSVGVTGSAAKGIQLALLRLDRIATALEGDTPLLAKEAVLRPSLPDDLIPASAAHEVAGHD